MGYKAEMAEMEALHPPEKSRGHVWRRDADGCIDVWVLAYDYHNGPGCIKCGYSYCHHCYDEPQEDCDGGDNGTTPHVDGE